MRQYSDKDLKELYVMVLETEEVFKRCVVNHSLSRHINKFKLGLVGEMAVRGLWDFDCFSPREVGE